MKAIAATELRNAGEIPALFLIVECISHAAAAVPTSKNEITIIGNFVFVKRNFSVAETRRRHRPGENNYYITDT